MQYVNENKLLFYSVIQGHDEFINRQFEAILKDKFDWGYFLSKAKYLGVVGGFLTRVDKSGLSIDKRVSGFLKDIAEHELYTSASMLSLFKEVSLLLNKNDIAHIPLKGCDKRIKRGELNFFNMMTDIDILVKLEDVEKTGEILNDSGYNYQGCFNGAHMNFYTKETVPRFIEIHWNLVNEFSPVQKTLFNPSMDNVWERSIIDGETRLLSWSDMLMHLTAHSIKEYFHKPKWLADIAWLIDNCPQDIDYDRVRKINTEWNTVAALGFISAILDKYIGTSYWDKAKLFGAKKPGLVKKLLAERMIDYKNLLTLRGYVYMASTGSFLDLLKIFNNHFIKGNRNKFKSFS